ncbi:carbonic anhydrase [Legionella jamestowniensis]|uniref:carbonic anhydrase n=1 Tax=Legionella jamestowniensis TaxID=455 RepID=A0A0W0UKF4_9GAMM|nr:carbonic anhydrase [Legionella jamestowniensis]KTD08220.1 carbonic anhydrase [Legionella jamestowniensis]OCH98543.1 hypothetical protein A8135_00425 [Legionella jamestowniensis]SFL98295.1 carbonic anhydrase [Legionella jamestowniensis DSM 19215]
MLIKLMSGIRKFCHEKFKEMQSLFQILSNGQYPDALFITCSDSRVDPNLFTHSNPGDLFAVRNVGNIIPPKETSTVSSEEVAIEYALNVLKIKNIILCGHSDCGAMKGLLVPDLKQQLPSVASWLSHSSTVITTLKERKDVLTLDDIVKQNVLVQIEHLKTYPAIAEKLKSKELTIHGWFYKFESGEIFIYQETHQDFIILEQALKTSIEDRKNQVVEQVAHEYLAQFLQPKTADEFQRSKQLFSSLKFDLSYVWDDLKPLVSEKLWSEIGELYDSQNDQEFQNLVASGVKTKLEDLKELKRNLQNSTGYHQFCNRHTLFMPAEPTLSSANNLNTFVLDM